jgi:hypothetical protein
VGSGVSLADIGLGAPYSRLMPIQQARFTRKPSLRYHGLNLPPPAWRHLRHLLDLPRPRALMAALQAA